MIYSRLLCTLFLNLIVFMSYTHAMKNENEEETRKLHHAIKTNNFILAQQCLTNNANPNRFLEHYTALGSICAHPEIGPKEKKEFIQLLLKHKANPKLGYCFLISNSLNQEIAELLLKCGANANEKEHYRNKESILHKLCIKSNDSTMVNLFLKYGANPNAKNSLLESPLHFACTHSKRNLALIETLIKNGANLEASDISKETPLHVVCYKIFTYYNNTQCYYYECGEDKEAEEIIKLFIKSYLPSFLPHRPINSLTFKEKQGIINRIRQFIALQNINNQTAYMLAQAQSKTNIIAFFDKLNTILNQEGSGYDALVKLLESN